MKKATWLDRDEYIWKCAFEIRRSFQSTKNFLLEHPMLGATGVDVDIDGILSKYETEYIRNPGYLTKRQINKVKLDIVNLAYSQAGTTSWSGEYQAMLRRHWEELRKA